MHHVSEFIVVAPANQSKAMTWAETRLLAHLRTDFPHFSFQVEPFGPLSSDDEFTVIPIMGRAGGEDDEPDLIYMCKPLEPHVIPEIMRSLRAFDVAGERAS